MEKGTKEGKHFVTNIEEVIYVEKDTINKQ